MQYKAIYINSQKKWRDNDTIEMKFIIVDEDNNVVTDLSSFTISAEIYDAATEIQLDNDAKGGITTSNEVITISVSASQTLDLDTGFYRIELQISTSGKNYTVYNEEIRIVEDEVDW